MKKRKLKGFVLPTLYLLITISVFTGMVFLGNGLTLSNIDYDYGTGVLKDNVESVISKDELLTSKISAPIEDSMASISIHFYSKDAEEKTQENSLIYYENTYMPNTGVFYTSDTQFNVLTVFDGKVIEINDDDFFGKYVVVEHTKNLKTYYYGLDELEVKVNDEITTGAVLGISTKNEIQSNKNSFLLEVYYNNELINPETFIGTKIADYK